MLDIAQMLVTAAEQFLQTPFAGKKRQTSEVFLLLKQKIESKEDQIAGLAVRKRGLQRREIRRAVMIQGADFSVDDAVRQFRCRLCDGGEFSGPIQTFAGQKAAFAVRHAQLHAIAVELDFVDPL